MRKSIVDIYLECGDFNKAVRMSGMPTLAAERHAELNRVRRLLQGFPHSSGRA